MANNVSNEPKTCVECGKSFIPNSSRQKRCKEPHYGKCPVCGNEVEIKDFSIGPQACSKECRQKRIEDTCTKKYGSKHAVNSNHARVKAKQTYLEKYGVEHISQSPQYKEKVKATNRRKYGTDHAMQSSEIKAKVVATNRSRLGVDYPAQNENIKAKVKDTVTKKYGGYAFNSPEIKAKIETTMVEKYGVVNAMQNEDIKARAVATNIKKYGVANPMQNPEILEKAHATSLLIYGTPFHIACEEVREKVLSSVRTQYGVDNVFASKEIMNKIKDTNQKLYGVDNPMQNEEIKRRAIDTNISKYGAVHYAKSDIAIKSRMLNPDRFDNFKLFKQNAEQYILNTFTQPPSIKELAKDLGIDVATVCYYISDNELQHIVQYHISSMEAEVADFILSIIPNIKLVRNIRSIIPPKELDLYFPEYNIAIECNPTYTHNSSKDSFDSGMILPPNYHKDKTIECTNKGIFLFHIFGHNWTNQQDIVKSMLRNVFKVNSNNIYARNCSIKEVSHEVASYFLNNNHIQGSVNAGVRLGLYYKDELVSLMLFMHPRKTMGNPRGENHWELVRFCSKLDTNIVGGCSKLFKAFINKYSPSSIVSFSNKSYTKGNVYEVLGFVKDSELAPNYCWVNEKTDEAINRVRAQKRNLKKLLNDKNLDIENNTEVQLMEDNGYVRVFDSGLIKWVWSK